MQTIEVSTWEDFDSRAQQLRQTQRSAGGSSLPMLFRGQRESGWPLATSLERRTNTEMPFEDYYRLVSIVKPQIETFTDNQWKIPEYPEVRKLAEDYRSLSMELSFGRLPGYEYLAHLRHHGFPSPLLDWTTSPYISAYFAFQRQAEGSHVSIYALAESRMKLGSSGVPTVYEFGPNVKTHRRHFLQQCSYTICLAHEATTGWRFVSHETPMAFAGPDQPDHSNFEVHKFNIPSTERVKVLRKLDEYNLNAFSLFGSEESLMETIAIRKLELLGKF